MDELERSDSRCYYLLFIVLQRLYTVMIYSEII